MPKRATSSRKHLASVGGDVELARQQIIEVLLDPTNRFMTMLSFAAKVAGILSLMRWHVLRFDGPALAYSDHHVVLWPMNVERTRPFREQILGPLMMLEIRAPIAPDAAILMNWIVVSDVAGVSSTGRAAAELNLHDRPGRPGMDAPAGKRARGRRRPFSPLSRLVDPSYDRAAAEQSARRALADKFNRRASKRRRVNELEVVVGIGSEAALRAAAA